MPTVGTAKIYPAHTCPPYPTLSPPLGWHGALHNARQDPGLTGSTGRLERWLAWFMLRGRDPYVYRALARCKNDAKIMGDVTHTHRITGECLTMQRD